MKRLFGSLLLLVCAAGLAAAQITFSVKPGLTFNGAALGLKLGPLVVTGGIDYSHIGSNVEEGGMDVNYTYTSQYVSGYGWVYNYGYNLTPYSDKYEASFNLYIPSVNVKLMLGGPEKVSAYVTASLSKPILTGSASSDGKEEDIQKYLDNLSITGFQLGFGGEYFLSDNFSIGGEFGLRMLSASYEQTETNTQSVQVGNSVTGYQYKQVETTDRIVLEPNLSLTYSVMTLNFYF